MVLLCGTSFSGKSTMARVLAPRLAARVVSLDEINERRGLWGGDGIPPEEWRRTHAVAVGEVREVVGAGASVIVDDTSSLRFLRDDWRALAAEAGAEFALLYVDVDHGTVRRRHAGNRVDPRRRDVADAVLEQHLADFQAPTADENAVRVASVEDVLRWCAASGDR
nr:ATP-binding protein [Kribbella shirazensis]